MNFCSLSNLLHKQLNRLTIVGLDRIDSLILYSQLSETKIEGAFVKYYILAKSVKLKILFYLIYISLL